MSLEEQQAKIADLSSRVRELMDAGRYDDALDLLTEGLTAEQKQEIIDSLMGDVEEKRRQDRREREQRMEERIRNGRFVLVELRTLRACFVNMFRTTSMHRDFIYSLTGPEL